MKLIASLVFAGTLTHIGALYIGLHIGEARAEKPIVLTKTCPAPTQYTSWNCSSSELREYRNICLRRMKGATQ